MQRKGKDMIRQARQEDLEQIEGIYAAAREYMQQTGNPGQWGTNYPPVEVITGDLEKGVLYVLEDAGEVYGVFMFAVCEDPTYLVIKDGEWKNQTPYGVIHRVASSGTHHGLMKEIVSYCAQQMPHLRMDTHENNKTMQHQILANGFEYCGIIYTRDGSERLAYERV